MRRTQTSPLIILAPALCAMLLLSACGGTDGQDPVDVDTQVTALNLETGERQLFDCATSVPRGWAVCSDMRCIIPPAFPCTELGPGACMLSDRRCQLKLRCEFDLSGGSVWHAMSASPDSASSMAGDLEQRVAQGSPDDRYGAPPNCEFACVAQHTPQLPCEDLRESDACQKRPDCQWEQLYTIHNSDHGDDPSSTDVKPGPNDAPDGTDEPMDQIGMPCPPDICGPRPTGICVPRRPASCDELDKATCYRRDDCRWDQGPCDLLCLEPRNPGDELKGDHREYCEERCQSSCRPAPLPPVCQPAPEPRCGDESVSAPIMDDNGCVVGYECKPMPRNNCAEMNQRYQSLLRDAKRCDPPHTIDKPFCADEHCLRPLTRCTEHIASSLMCECPTAVNPDNQKALAALHELTTAWADQRCGHTAGNSAVACSCAIPQGSGCGFNGSCVDYGMD